MEEMKLLLLDFAIFFKITIFSIFLFCIFFLQKTQKAYL